MKKRQVRGIREINYSTVKSTGAGQFIGSLEAGNYLRAYPKSPAALSVTREGTVKLEDG